MAWDRLVKGVITMPVERYVHANREEVAREQFIELLCQEFGISEDLIQIQQVDPAGDWCSECFATRTVDGERPCPECTSEEDHGNL